MTGVPRAGGRPAPAAGRWPPVDHSWVDDGLGVLSCVAGDEHTTDVLAVCPYYLREDVVGRLARRHPLTAPREPTVTRADGRFHKISDLTGPEGWSRLIGHLPPEHGLHPLRWSLFTGLERRAGLSVIDPRDAFAAALDCASGDGRAGRVLAELAAGIGDVGGARRCLGLTGSAALDPTRLGYGGDVDLVVYPAVTPARLADALAGIGARTLADIATDPRDGHVADYLASRMMPPITDTATARVVSGRRTDVAWVGRLRLDLTTGAHHAHIVPTLQYEIAPAGPAVGTATIGAADPGYPVLHTMTAGEPAVVGSLDARRFDGHVPAGAAGVDADRLLITARGFQGAFRAGDRIRYVGALHRRPTEPAAFVSIDDAAGHTLELLTEGPR